MSSDWTIVELKNDRSQSLLPLFERVWPQEFGHSEKIRWAFQTNPLGAGILMAATPAKDTMTPIAARGSIVWPVTSGDDVASLKVHQFHGTCVHPDFRRMGIFTALNRVFLERFAELGGDAIFNISVASSRAGYEKLGWSYISGFHRLILVLRPLRVLQTLLTRKARAGFCVNSIPSQRPPSFEQVADANTKRNAILDGRFFTHYDDALFQWRYDNLAAGYRFVVDKTHGFCSYKAGRRGSAKEVLVGDIWPLGTPYRSIGKLLWRVVRREKPHLVSVLVSRSHPYHRYFRALAFFPDPKGDLNHGVRPISEKGREFLQPSRWALMTADIDTY